MRAVILLRVSTKKQALEGDFDNQLKECQFFIDKNGWEMVQVLTVIESGRVGERLDFKEVIDYCCDKQNKVDVLVAKDISRFTRQGPSEYQVFKKALEKAGVEIKDAHGTIRDKVNTMEAYGLQYSWSVNPASEAEELREAQSAKEEVTRILSRMIGSEIGYTRKGYWNRKPPYGYLNKKIETANDGKRNILIDYPDESFFIKKMYQMVSDGHPAQQIVDELNALGFVSHRLVHRDKRTQKQIGVFGGKPLNVKKLQEFLPRVIYAGIICEKWTLMKPIKAQFEGLVGIDLFNKVNAGKVKIVQDDDENITLLYGKESSDIPIVRMKSHHNPLYPFKNVVLCPVCSKPLHGSAPTGRLGKRHPGYHCARGHISWRVKLSTFHETVYGFIQKLECDPDYVRLIEESLMDVWGEKRQELTKDSSQAESYLAELKQQQTEVYDSIKTASSPALKKRLEADYNTLEDKILVASVERNKKEKKEYDIKYRIKCAKYYLEHLGELLIDTDNSLMQEQLFAIPFITPPTYNDLVNGTPNLVGIIRLKGSQELSKSALVNLTRESWNTVLDFLSRLEEVLPRWVAPELIESQILTY